MAKAYDPRRRDGARRSLDEAQARPSQARFRVRAKLGRSGAGDVVRAYDRETGIDVALKSILRAEGDALLRFKREFRALRDVRHPNLVELFELIERDGEWLYTMELVDGVEPLDYVRAPAVEGSAEAGFDETKLRALLVQLASGLDALHRAGMVHRDVKPSNVLVTREGRVVLLDFGLVASANEGFQSTDVPTAGTVCYMAPEQGLGMPVAPASDWYAFGVLLFEALTGRAPYEGMTLEILLAKAQRPACEPRELVPSVPEDLSRLCARLLALDPADRPSGAEVLACLGAGPAPHGGRADPVEATALVGREKELAELRAAAARAFAGAQVEVQVEGDPGVGKSAFIAAVVESLREEHPELLVLRGKCDPRERVPYQGLDGILDGLSSYLRRRATTHPPLSSAVVRLSHVFPVLRRVPSVRAARVDGPGRREGDDELLELAWALRALLAHVAAANPTLLVLEDVHWLDDESRELLTELMRPPSAPHVLVLKTRRREDDEEPGDLVLGPLSEAEAETLALGRSRHIGGLAAVAAIAREAEGNPRTIEDLVALAEREGVAAPTFDDLVTARLDALDEGGRLLLQLCASSGSSVARSVLVVASGFSAVDAHRDLRALVAAGLLRVTGGSGIAVYHPRLAASVRRRLDPELARALHLRLAEAHAAVGPSGVQRRVEHLAAAGERAQAAALAEKAADDCEGDGEVQEAAELYRLAIAAAPSVEGSADPRLEALGRALARAGRSDEAASAFLEAATRAAPTSAIELRRRAAEQLAFSGRFGEARMLFAELMRELGTRFPPMSPLARLACLSLEAWMRIRRVLPDGHGRSREERNNVQLSVLQSASVALAPADGAAGLVHVPWAARLALKVRDPAAASMALGQTAAAIAFWTGARKPRTSPLLARARALAEATHDPVAMGTVATCEGVTLMLHGEWAPASAAFARAEALPLDRSDALGILRTARATTLQCLFWLGRFEELRQQVADMRLEAEASGDRYFPVRLQTALLPLLACIDDRPGEGLEAADAAVAEWPELGLEQRQTFLRTKALVHAYEGRFELARDLLRERPGLGRTPYRVQVLRISMRALGALFELAAARSASERADAARTASRAAKKLDREASSWAAALSTVVHAAESAGAGEPARAAELLEMAATGFAACGMKAHALACRRHAAVLEGAPETDPRIVGANAWLRSQGVVRPDRFCVLLVPFATPVRSCRS